MSPRTTITLLFSIGGALAQGIPTHAEKSELATYFLPPTRIVWTSEKGVENAENLLKAGRGQTTLNDFHSPAVFTPGENSGSLVLDFGNQISGHLELFCAGENKGIKCKTRIRFCESVSESMADTGDRGAQKTTTPSAIGSSPSPGSAN